MCHGPQTYRRMYGPCTLGKDECDRPFPDFPNFSLRNLIIICRYRNMRPQTAAFTNFQKIHVSWPETHVPCAKKHMCNDQKHMCHVPKNTCAMCQKTHLMCQSRSLPKLILAHSTWHIAHGTWVAFGLDSYRVF